MDARCERRRHRRTATPEESTPTIAVRYQGENDYEDPVRDRSHKGESECLRSCAQPCSCEQGPPLHPSRGARHPSVFMATERTARTSDQPATTCRPRRRPGSNRRATRRSGSRDCPACECQESRSGRPWIQPAARLAAVQGRLSRRTCAPPRGVGSADCALGRSLGQRRPENVDVSHRSSSSQSDAAKAISGQVLPIDGDLQRNLLICCPARGRHRGMRFHERSSDPSRFLAAGWLPSTRRASMFRCFRWPVRSPSVRWCLSAVRDPDRHGTETVV